MSLTCHHSPHRPSSPFLVYSKQLFSLSLDIDGTPQQLQYFEGDEPRVVAENFLNRFGLLREENVNLIVQSIQSNLAAL